MTDYPSIHEDLERKTLGALANLALRREQGYITEREYFNTVRTLFMAVGGLISTEVTDLLSMEEPEDMWSGRYKSDHAWLLMRENNSKAVVIRPMPDNKGYGIYTNDTDKPLLARTVPFEVGSKEAEKWLSKTLQKFQSKGYTYL